MKKLLLLMLIAPVAFCQNSRWDYTAMTTQSTSADLVPILAIKNAPISFYTGCTTLPCTTYASVYNTASSTTPCINTRQVVQQMSTICSPTADSQGNFGGWFSSGTYQYTITHGSTVFGPYQFSVGGGGSSGAEINNQISGNVPLATDQTKLNAPSHISESGGTTTISQPLVVNGTITGNIPPSQITFPPACSSGVYVPAGNTCVAPGTAANAAGANGEAQVNAGGSFSAITGSAPLGTNGMQYAGDLKAANFIGAASVWTPASIGYKQNAGAAGVPSTAIAHNRDQTTAMFATPQDFCPNSGSGPPFDDTPCFNKAIRWLASQNNNAAKTLNVPWTPNGYYLPKEGAQFLYTLPYDFGDYHGSAWYLTQASASVYFSGGKLTSCSIQGGSGYAPNAQLPIQILDPQHLGSGAVATVLTDATGTPASTCVIQLAGMNYPQVGVMANVIPLGGHGAVGVCTLTAGTFATTCSVTQGGSGYNDGVTGPRIKPPAGMAGLTCTTFPSLTVSVTGTSVTGVTTTAGTGCTYTGGDGPVPIQFGASCGGVQCTILPPETPQNLPLSVALLNGVSIVGIGNPTINTSYFFMGLVAPVFSEPIAFGDPWGDQSAAIRPDLNGTDMNYRSNQGPIVRNITVNAQIDFAFPLLANGTFDTVTCKGGICFYIGQMQQSSAGNFRGDTEFTNDSFLGVSGIFVGGDWDSRGPDSFAGGNYGGTWMAHNPLGSGADSILYGGTGGIDIENLYVQFNPISMAAWDTWVEQYIWKAPNSPAVPKTDATHLLSNLTATCPTSSATITRIAIASNVLTVTAVNGYMAGMAVTFSSVGTNTYLNGQTVTVLTATSALFTAALTHADVASAADTGTASLAFTTRATDNNFGNTGSYTSYPWLMCYRGIGEATVSALPRYGTQLFTVTPTSLVNTNNTLTMRKVRVTFPWRPVWFGYAQMVDIRDVWTLTPIATADPYLPAGATACAGVPCTNSVIWMASNTFNTFSLGKFEGINNTSATISTLRSSYFGLSAAADTGNTANANLFVRSVIGAAATTTYPDQSFGSSVTSSLTTTGGTSDVVTITNSANPGGYTFRGTCQLQATNATAATNIATTFISAKANNQITVTHAAVSGMTYAITCNKYF